MFRTAALILLFAVNAAGCGVAAQTVTTSTQAMATQIGVAKAALTNCRESRDEAQCQRVADSLDAIESTNEDLAARAR